MLTLPAELHTVSINEVRTGHTSYLAGETGQAYAGIWHHQSTSLAEIHQQGEPGPPKSLPEKSSRSLVTV